MALSPVTRLSQLWEGELYGCTVEGRPVLVVRLPGRVLAFEDRCAHLGVRLSEGTLDGEVLTCSAHHQQYDACTGRGTNPRGVCLTRFALEIDGDEVLVDVGRAWKEADDGRGTH